MYIFYPLLVEENSTCIHLIQKLIQTEEEDIVPKVIFVAILLRIGEKLQVGPIKMRKTSSRVEYLSVNCRNYFVYSIAHEIFSISTLKYEKRKVFSWESFLLPYSNIK